MSSRSGAPASEHPRSPQHRRAGRAGMGYQPGLDGIRAMSVIGVMLYHAGFSWMHGGFFGVEVFFVVSGFLITSLLIEERDRAGSVSLRMFWVRRFRRLLPALLTMLLAVGVWTVFWGSSEQHTQMRRDFPWGLGYLANWGAIFSQQSYWGAGSPRLLRHLWSLAVEEQWYLLWPLTFIVIARRRGDDVRRGRNLATLSIGVMVATAIASVADWPRHVFNPFRMAMQAVEPSNFLYLSTFSRSSGLLLGAAMAFVWRPWQTSERENAEAARWMNVAAAAAVVVLLGAFTVGRVESAVTYRLLLPVVTLASAGLVGIVVHPWAASTRALFGSRPMAEIGKRSYGLYLWSWPISRMCNADSGSVSRFLLAMAIAIPVSEACYRLVEVPIRSGGLRRWWTTRRREDRTLLRACVSITTVAVVGSMGVFFASAAKVFDPARDTSTDVVFDPGSAAGVSTTVAVSPTGAVGTSEPSTSAAVTTTTQPALPRRVVIVGDSTAHSLAINLPDGVGSTFTIGDGSVDGCSVYESGSVLSARAGFSHSFGGCAGWEQKWVAAAQRNQSQLALVVVGAWDVFDVSLDGQTLAFSTAANDQRFMAGVQKGIDTLSAAGVKVALLEIPCMRPKDVKGAGVPALPERGDDARVAHLNELLRQVAAANPATTTFVAGPQQYCTDEAIATDLGYRWDGVHAYKPGANLTLETITSALLAIPVT